MVVVVSVVVGPLVSLSVLLSVWSVVPVVVWPVVVWPVVVWPAVVVVAISCHVAKPSADEASEVVLLSSWPTSLLGASRV